MNGPPPAKPNRLLVAAAGAPHLGKIGFAILVVAVGCLAIAERTGQIGFVTMGFLAFAAGTGVLFLLSLYDLGVTVLQIRYRAAGRGSLPEPFRIASDVALEYIRWLAPLGFVVGIIFGHYFWQ